MAFDSNIEWCHATFNPWIGCTKVGPGCDNCYAADLAQARLGVPWGSGQPRRRTAASTWKQPRRWNNRAAKLGIRYRVFCASLADVFDNEVPAEWRADLFQLIRDTPHLDWLLVTKRIGNAAKMADAAEGLPGNVWLGATMVNQPEWDRDIWKLKHAAEALGARYSFVSIEPMLGPINPRIAELPDWVIVGGESGPRARPMHPDWARSLRDQCAAAGVPFLFKQWGEWADMRAAGIVQDGPVTDRRGNVRDWMNRYVVFADDAGAARVRGHSFTSHATDLVYRVGKKAAGRLLDGVQHDGFPLKEAVDDRPA